MYKQEFQETRNLIEDGWTQGVYARNEYNEEVYLGSSEAIKFCLIGALRRSFFDFEGVERIRDFRNALEIIQKELIVKAETNDVIKWQDTKGRTKEEILQLLNDVIEEA